MKLSPLSAQPSHNLESANATAASSSLQPSIAQLKMAHHVSVCVIPPSPFPSGQQQRDSTCAWEPIMQCRRELQDPQYYRWPPHINLLYPFLDISPLLKKEPPNETVRDGASECGTLDWENDDDGLMQTIIQTLADACSTCEPFQVELAKFGTFGGKQRGVLWLDPEIITTTKIDTRERANPLIDLQATLAQSFPQYSTASRPFRPHMTVTHTATLNSAHAAEQHVQRWWRSVSFTVDRIHLLHRAGPDDPFRCVAHVALGENAAAPRATVYSPPKAFDGMPAVEEDWVQTSRKALQQRRRKSARIKRRSTTSGSSPDD